MKMLKVIAVTATLAGLHSISSAATFDALSGVGFTTETASSENVFLKPLAPPDSTVASYSVLSTLEGFQTTGILQFAAPVTSYTFLWGSPDSYNSVSDGFKSYSGSDISAGTGNNSDSQLFTYIDDGKAFSSLIFKTTGVAFELAAAPVAAAVPEPQTYAFLLLGLAGIGMVARRRSE